MSETVDEVVILLATISSLHRLRFPHPHRLPQPSSLTLAGSRRTGLSIFHNFSVDSLRDPRDFHVLSTVYPIYGSTSAPSGPLLCHSWLDHRRDAVFLLSQSSGSLVAVRMEADKVTSFEFKSSNLMDKLKGFVPSIMRSSQESEEAALCLSSHAFVEDTMVVGLCRDLKIRFWSFSRQKCVHSLSLALSLQVTGESGGSLAVRRPSIRKLDVGDALTLVLFLNVNDVRRFLVYKITYRDGGIEAQQLACLNTDAGEDLLDFQVCHQQLLYLTLTPRMQSRVKVTSLQE